jgi:hypothetical protein
VKIENERVRVREYKDRPGEKTHQHTHPTFVLVALSLFKRKITLSDGKAMMRESRQATCSGRTHKPTSAICRRTC